MTAQTERYKQKLEMREAEADPIRMEAAQIDTRVQQSRELKFQELADQQKQKLNDVGLQVGPVDWVAAAKDGAITENGVAYQYMADNNPNRYFLGVDLATGRTPELHSTGAAATDPNAQQDVPWYKKVSNFFEQVPGGVGEALVNTGEKLRNLGADQNIPNAPTTEARINEDLARWGVPSDRRSDPDVRAAYYRLNNANVSEALREQVREQFPMPNNLASEFARPMSKYLTGMIPAMRALQGIGMGSFTASVVGGGIASTAVWENGEPTLSNMLIEFDNPVLNNAVTQYLAIREDDPQNVQQLKQALEDMGMGGATEMLLRSLKAIKNAPWGEISHLEVKGRLMLSDFYKGRKMMYGGAPSTEEMKAWSYILAGKIAKGAAGGREFTKQMFEQQVIKMWGQEHLEEAVEKIWKPARRIMNDTRGAIRKMVGAPHRVVRTPKARDSMVDLMTHVLDTDTIDFKSASEWWRQSGDGIRQLAGDDPNKMELYTRLFALYGQSAGVQTNVTAVMNQLKHFADTGSFDKGFGRFPEKIRPIVQEIVNLDKPFDTSMKGVEQKLHNYYLNLKDEVFGTNEAADAVTIDTWMGRLFGFGEMPNGKQYDWSADMVRDVTKKYNASHGTNYKPREVQAAMWAYAKNVWENGGHQGQSITFSSEVQRRTTYIPWEAVPAPETGKLQDFYDWPESLRRKFTDDAAKLTKASNGEDLILSKLGINGMTSGESDAFGTWAFSFSPNRVAKVRGTSSSATAADTQKAQLATLMKQYAYMQHEAIFFRPSKSGTQAALFQMKNTDVAAQKALYAAIKKHMPQAEGTFIGDEFHVVLLGDGAADKAAQGEAAKQLKAALSDPEVQALIDEPMSGLYKAEVMNGTDEAGKPILGSNRHDWKADPDGTALERDIARAGGRDLLPWLRNIRKEYQQLVEQYSRKADVVEIPERRPSAEGISFGEVDPADLGIEEIVMSGHAPDRPFRGEGPKATVTKLQPKLRDGERQVNFVHYSKNGSILDLDPRHFANPNTGIGGADVARVNQYEEAPKRVYGYVVNEAGDHTKTAKETGLGNAKYKGTVNAYDMRKDPLGLRDKAAEIAREKYPTQIRIGDAGQIEYNTAPGAPVQPGSIASIYEQLIQQNGFRGYVDDETGVVVMFSNVPVERVE